MEILHVGAKALWRLDLAVGGSKRARQALELSDCDGISPELHYMGIDRLKAEHWMPEFSAGPPPLEKGPFLVGTVLPDGAIRAWRAEGFDRRADAWVGPGVLRGQSDLWMPASNEAAAMSRALQRALRS